ncbi:MAG: TonB-dependent receptor [Candidatus Latescibacteria bacterium]|nr:TonB-dependent receptor [Candidatus Latescibacterota bacterium]
MNGRCRTSVVLVSLGALLAYPRHDARAWPVPSTALLAPGVVTGRVIDARTGQAVASGSVALDTLSLEVGTDASGRFALVNVPPGVRTLTISHAEYMMRKTAIAVSAADTITVEVLLLPRTLSVDPIVVTATRSEQTARMAPASVTVLSGDEIAYREPVTFDQAVETVPGLSAFRSTGGISVQSMSIRGSSDVAGGGVGNRVLLLIDGRPALTSDSGGAFWSLVPVQFIERVEVVKGAFSSLYGSTAMGGVINVITRRPGPVSSGKLEMKLGFYEKPPADIRYTDENVYQSEVTADYSTRVGRTSFLVSATRKESDGYAENTAFEFYDVYGKVLYDFASDRKLEFTLGGGRAENDYPHSWLNSAQPLEVRDAYTDDLQEKDYASADLWYWGFSGENVKYSMRAYYYRHEQRSFFNEDDPNEEVPGNEPYGLRTSIEGDKIGNLLQLDWRLRDRHLVIAGADVQIDHVVSSPDTVMYGDHQINNYSVFLQDDFTFARTLTFTVGGRYDWNHLVGERTLEQFSPKLGLVWTPDARISLRALYGQAFRAPTIAEMFLQKELGGGVEFLPNPDLQAERLTLSAEAGVRYSPVAMLDLDAAVFRYEYEDMIYWEDISAETGIPSLYQVRNLNAASMQGFEVSARSRWRALTTSANYTYLDARDESETRADDTLPYRPEHTASVGADVDWLRWSFHGDARYRSEIGEVFLYPLQAPDAFWVFNAAAQCRLNGAWTLSLRVANLLDTSYEEVARYRMPGRNWLVGAAMHF